MQAITEHAKKHGHVSKIAKLDWLRNCLQQRSLLAVAKNLMLDSAALSALVAQQKAEAAAKLQPAKTAVLQATQVISVKLLYREIAFLWLFGGSSFKR